MKRIKKKTIRKESIRKVKARVWALFSRCIRRRDCLATTGSLEYGECVTCDNQFEFNDLQAGHFVPKHSGNYFSKRGVHAQCKICNLYGRDGQAAGMPHEYRRQMVKLYGEDVTLELEGEARQIKKYTIKGLKELEEILKQQLKEA